MKSIVILLYLFIVLLALSCSAPKDESANAPPSFLDPAPNRPTSETTIWAGINLMTEPPTNDYVLVIHKNQIMKWGKRGSIEVPHDSVGIDMRRYWIKHEPANSLRYDDSGKIDLTNFEVIEGEKMGVKPTNNDSKVIARIKDSKIVYFQESEL